MIYFKNALEDPELALEYANKINDTKYHDWVIFARSDKVSESKETDGWLVIYFKRGIPNKNKLAKFLNMYT